MTSSLLGAFAEVLLLNLVLSGDNAVVIGLAARGLTAEARKRAIILGGGFAVGLRLILTLPAEYLLTVPFLRAGGGGLLMWVAYRLLTEDEGEGTADEAATIGKAIRLIVLADLTMSLDNILAVAAVAERSDHDVLVLIVGLALSIPIVLLGGNIVARLMNRLPILVWIGAAILGYTAGELIVEDKAIDQLFERIDYMNAVLPFFIAAGVLTAAWVKLHYQKRNTGSRRISTAASQH
jgi:YjbE family integral membrane protein